MNMIWKESYRLGIDQVDQQHMELFRMTDELVNAVTEHASRQTFENILAFLKQYVIEHFRDEEAYQAEIQYPDIQAHKAEHAKFTKTISDYEKRLIASNYDLNILKDLTGTLAAWLIYHVADTDQKLVTKENVKTLLPQYDLNVNLFSESALEVMEKMAGFSRSSLTQNFVTDHKLSGDVLIEINLIGQLTGKAIFGFSKKLALSLFQIMTSMEMTEVDEMVQSALCELTNISCGNATINLTKQGIACDITPPSVIDRISQNTEFTGVFIDTGSGGLEVAVFTD